MQRKGGEPVDRAGFRTDWVANLSIADICKKHGITKDQLIRLRDLLGLPKRHDRRLRIRRGRQRDPTPREIEKLCKEIRESWSDKTERERRVSKTARWEIPVIELPDQLKNVDEQDS